MRLQITYLVENDGWSEEEYDEKSERTVILETSDLVRAIERIITLEPGEAIDDVWRIKELK